MRILLADDHALFRDGLASLLRAMKMNVVGQASDGLEALEKARALRPALILMDIGMPRCDGLEATRRIKAEMPEIKVIMLTVSDDRDDLFEAIKSGAHGYLLKNLSAEEFGAMLARIATGEVALSPTLATRIWKEFSREKSSAQDAEDSLSKREMEVLQLAAKGQTNKEIGAGLFVSESTVKYHIKNILGKLHLKNRSQVVAFAIRKGMVKKAD
ncbi:MAG: response regulator transcription factor [Chloroflexi bacterium]|nr:response regulator transcription factor [Chloroflexota bacterium]